MLIFFAGLNPKTGVSLHPSTWHCSSTSCSKQSSKQRENKNRREQNKNVWHHHSGNTTLLSIFRKDRIHDNDKPQLVTSDHIKTADPNKSSACGRDVFIRMWLQHCTCSPIHQEGRIYRTGSCLEQQNIRGSKTISNSVSDHGLVATDICWFA